jgi:hypothetical protein
MTIEQGAHETDVKIRVPTRRAWIFFLVLGGGYLAIAALSLTGGWPSFLFILLMLPIGCCLIAFALALRTLGVDLTPEFAVVRSAAPLEPAARECSAGAGHERLRTLESDRRQKS